RRCCWRCSHSSRSHHERRNRNHPFQQEETAMTNHDNSNAGFAILTTLVTSVGPNGGCRPKSQLRVGSSIERKIRSTSEWFMLIGDRERDHCGCEHIWE